MSYQPNVVNKGDIVVINGRTFEVVQDFNALKDKKLKLRMVRNETPRTHFATIDDDLALMERIRRGEGLPKIGK